jgi:hypothetical protein
LPPEVGSIRFEHFSRNKNGDTEIHELPQKKCTIDILDLEFKGMACIDLEKSDQGLGIIRGNYFSSSFQYVKASFLPCIQTSVGDNGIMCKTREEMKDWLS